MIETAGTKPITTLNASQKHETVYCVPVWVRDEQIRSNCRRVKDRLVPATEQVPGSIAIVGFGPSLKQTWKSLSKFEHIITVSGSHAFLLERGMTPEKFTNWWHVEVDPREHKLKLLGTPRMGIQYLPASCVHPKYVQAIIDAEADLKLWHVFAKDGEADQVIPRGEWMVTGGCDVGMRALTIARVLGFTDVHIFGLDGCLGKEGLHAGEHPNQPKKYAETIVNGKKFLTTIGLLESAKQVFHELDQMPDVTFKFYGKGLTQTMAQTYKRKPSRTAQLAEMNPELISQEFCSLNRKLHEENAYYGVGGGKHAKIVKDLVAKCGYKSILDYGCGKGFLQKELEFPIWNYDPAIPEFAARPRPAELVVCTDVLEHIEPEKLRAVLQDLRQLTLKTGYFVIHLGAAKKFYADGRNTHLIQQKPAWWRRQLTQYFTVTKQIVRGPEMYVVVGPK